MAAERIRAFREAQQLATAQTLSQLGDRVKEAKQRQEAEWAVRQAAIKAGEQQRLADLKAKQEAEEAIAHRKHQIRLQQAKAAFEKEEAAHTQKLLAAQEVLDAERKTREATQKAIEDALAKATEEAVLTHPEYAKQPEGVKEMLQRLSQKDALECLNSPATLLGLQRKAFRETKR
jgi:hypothetical protein